MCRRESRPFSDLRHCLGWTHSAWAGHGLQHFHLQSGLDSSRKLDTIIAAAPVTSPVCYTCRLCLLHQSARLADCLLHQSTRLADCVPDSRWCTRQCEPLSSLLGGQAELASHASLLGWPSVFNLGTLV